MLFANQLPCYNRIIPPTRAKTSMRVVFLFNEYSLHNHIIEEFIKTRPQDQVAIIKVPLVLRGKGPLETARVIVPKLARRFLIGKLLEAFALVCLTLLPKIIHKGAVFRRLFQIARIYKLPYRVIYNINSKRSVRYIRKLKPDLIVTMFHQIVREDLISIPKFGIINIHPGIIPEFRGIQPYFWELSENFGWAGPTLHLIEDESIDTGRILAGSRYRTFANMSAHLNYYLTAKCAARLLPECVSLLERGELKPERQENGAGNYYRWPDDASLRRLDQAGHCLFSLSDLNDIISGRYDDFQAEICKFYK